MKIFNEKSGVSTIAALFTLLSMTAMGGVIAYLVSAGETSRYQQTLSNQALYVTQAGIEYAVKRIYDGQSEIVDPPGKTFGRGSFTVSRSGKTLTITATVGETVRIHKVDSPTEADCISIDTSNMNLQQNDKVISQITFRKICLPQITIDKMQFSWVPDNGERLTKIKIEDLTVYDNPPGSPSGTLLDIADYVATNPNNHVINRIEFNRDMEDKTVTMSFTMGDNTTKTTTFVADD